MSTREEEDRSADEEAIGLLLKRLGEAWSRGDGAAYGAGFTADADYVVFNGVHLKGRDQIAAVHQRLFDTVLKGTDLEGGPRTEDGGAPAATVRFLRPDVALVHSRGGVRMSGQSEVSPEQESIQTSVVVKQDGRWLITAFQNTRVQPSPLPAERSPRA